MACCPVPRSYPAATLSPATASRPGEGWRYEVKLDGYRVQVHKVDRTVAIFSRNGHDWTRRFPQIAGEIGARPGHAVIDGEIVATGADGLAPFRQLHATVNAWRDDGLVVFAFDLLAEGGKDIRALPYIERKARLARLVARAKTPRLLHSEPFRNGAGLFEECARRGLEGVVAKRADAPYRAGRSGCEAWKAANRERHRLFEPRNGGGRRLLAGAAVPAPMELSCFSSEPCPPRPTCAGPKCFTRNARLSHP